MYNTQAAAPTTKPKCESIEISFSSEWFSVSAVVLVGCDLIWWQYFGSIWAQHNLIDFDIVWYIYSVEICENFHRDSFLSSLFFSIFALPHFIHRLIFQPLCVCFFLFFYLNFYITQFVTNGIRNFHHIYHKTQRPNDARPTNQVKCYL